jgi:hypothetical protein
MNVCHSVANKNKSEFLFELANVVELRHYRPPSNSIDVPVFGSLLDANVECHAQTRCRRHRKNRQFIAAPFARPRLKSVAPRPPEHQGIMSTNLVLPPKPEFPF